MLSLALLLGCACAVAETAEKTEISTLSVNGTFKLKGLIPEGYGDNLGLPAPGALPWLAFASLVTSILLAVWAHRQFKGETKTNKSISVRSILFSFNKRSAAAKHKSDERTSIF